jgi:hypothetical protein
MPQLSNSTAIQYTLTVNTELSRSEIRKLETVLMRTLNYIQLFTGGNTDINKAINMAQAAITTFRSLQIAIRAAQLASGPIGWAYMGISLAAVAMSGYSMYEGMIGV